MLKEQPWLNYGDYLDFELLQAEAEGREVKDIIKSVDEIKSMNSLDTQREVLAEAFMDKIQSLQIKKDYRFFEPSELEEIKKSRPLIGSDLNVKLLSEHIEALSYDKVYGAWLGRCAGCLLGQPVEGWSRERITGLLKDTYNYPINYYISSDISEELRKKYDVSDEGGVYGSSIKNWINNVHHMPEDDDTNYTVISLKILEQYGMDFTPDDVAECWLTNLPILHTCTAERIAYKNIINLIYPPLSASHRNPYREWIGAQIRGDFFGYITPGNPELGAELAWRDASISHVKNGIYGEMFVAAMLSAAALLNDPYKIIQCGLSQIPEKSRLADAVHDVLSWKELGLNWEQAIDKVHKLYDEKIGYHWCHTIPNALIVCIALIYGETQLEKSIGIAVMAAFDTDCNGATVGSIVGMINGANALSDKWIKPLNNKLKSGVDGFGLVEISDLARRTVDMAQKAKSLNKIENTTLK
ncbi:MAG: ADP-ribosylation/Crystallin [Eubacterium sp.]|nr:ADP-ribosylation/Crystallin [Eubacterium sp.]